MFLDRQISMCHDQLLAETHTLFELYVSEELHKVAVEKVKCGSGDLEGGAKHDDEVRKSHLVDR